MEEIFEITDRVTVMREGKTIEASVPTTDLTGQELIRLMIGREISDVYQRSTSANDAVRASFEPVLEVSKLAVGKMVRDVSFSLHAGEILGLAGLVGAGRSETLEAIYGLRRKTGGSMRLNGLEFSPHSPREAISKGIGFIGEDRRRQSIVPDFSVTENILLAYLAQDRAVGKNYEKCSKAIAVLLNQLDMPAHVRNAPMLGLSGGQQQKAILARWLLVNPKVLLLDEPTRGVDIGTRQVIYRIIREIAAKGVGVLVVSSDFEEAIGLSDRIVVLSDGVSVTEAPSDLLDSEVLTMYSAPRSSAERMRGVLSDLAAEFGGAAYWIQLERDRVFALDTVDPAGINLGFARGKFPPVAESQVSKALSTPADAKYTNESGLHTVLHRLSNQRGHAFGWIGVTTRTSRPLEPELTSTALNRALRKHQINHIRTAVENQQEAV
jgi:ribose transport system ATP-binding protein/rhamnose transport system ATP-binding protein